MNTFKTILFAYLIALVSVTILPKFPIYNALPNLILVISLYLIFQNEIREGVIWGVAGGIFLNFLGFKMLSNTIITVAVILLTIFLVRKFFETSNVYIFLAFCFIGTIICSIFLQPSVNILVIAGYLLSSLYSALVGFLIYLIYRKKYSQRLNIIPME
ncbi:MAG: hypothetical protein NT135_00625 [Candidatus Berkelbacteria bacterium]|nr:hypothetical protein [Candidatus Berkelbacteria bacterium]